MITDGMVGMPTFLNTNFFCETNLTKSNLNKTSNVIKQNTAYINNGITFGKYHSGFRWDID